MKEFLVHILMVSMGGFVVLFIAFGIYDYSKSVYTKADPLKTCKKECSSNLFTEISYNNVSNIFSCSCHN